MGRSKEMPLEVAEHLARVVRPLREALGPQIAVAKRWGISQSHISQIELGAGCGISVLLTLREKLDMSLEELCYPPSKRKGASTKETAAPLDLDSIRAALRAELDGRRESSPPTEPPMPPKKGPSDAPRARRR